MRSAALVLVGVVLSISACTRVGFEPRRNAEPGDAEPGDTVGATGDTLAPTCTDSARNGDETDIDCGGACGPTCILDQTCTVDGDCVSTRCINGTCDEPCLTFTLVGPTTFDPQLSIAGGPVTPQWRLPDATLVDGAVISVDLAGVGPVSVELYPRELCPLIDTLDANNDALAAFPSDIAQLANITELRLEDNLIDEPVPAAVGDLNGLTRLYIHGNAIIGPLPPALGSSTVLTSLRVYDNRLSGDFPAWLGNLTGLREINFDNNEFTGPIPPELGALTEVTEVRLQNNSLTGTIPPELGNLTNARLLYLSGNQLTGTVPAELASLTDLGEFRLSHNNFTGVSAGTLAPMVSVGLIYLHDNNFDQATVDAVLGQVFDARASYVDSAPALRLGGTNAAPSGNAIDPTVTPGNGMSDGDWSWNGSSHDPVTGSAMAYDLANDVRGEGFVRWLVLTN